MIGLIERPEYKRRWFRSAGAYDDRNVDDEMMLDRALRAWLLDRIEALHAWGSVELLSCSRIADELEADPEYLVVASAFRRRAGFDTCALVIELIDAESVPLLPVLRFAESGLRTHASWERMWEFQRMEDTIRASVEADEAIVASAKFQVVRKRIDEDLGAPPTPQRYEPKDFRRPNYWALRGKLDVPKERFVSFPSCERDVDPTPVVAWAGWDHLQFARAIAAYYERVKNQEGWAPERRIPLLAGILELLPWLKQWHNDIHPEFRERMGDFFEQFVQDEARAMEMTVEQIRAWTPPVQAGRGRRRRSS